MDKLVQKRGNLVKFKIRIRMHNDLASQYRLQIIQPKAFSLKLSLMIPHKFLDPAKMKSP